MLGYLHPPVLNRRRRTAALALAIAGFALLPAGCKPPPPPQEEQPAPIEIVTPKLAPTPALNPDLPFDVTVKPPVTLESLQVDFDRFSWDSFVALNWPPNAEGGPDKGKIIGANGDNATVWQTFKESSEVFLPNGAKPSPWGSAGTLPPDWPAACKDKLAPGARMLRQVGKTPTLLEASDQPFKTGPLIDQNGRYARFEILMNRPMFDYIASNTLYSKAGQTAFKPNVVFPCGSAKDKSYGAMMVKVAWKVLDPAEVKSGRFHTATAIVYTPASKEPPVAEKCEEATVGLVGMHIVTKTSGSPQWIWSTFEHVDNCPTDGEPIEKPAYNFYAKAGAGLKINEPPLRPWNPTATEPPARRSQVVRMIPITPAARTLNSEYQAALKAASPNGNSVWQYYELVSTQWPTKPSKDCDVLVGAPVDRIGTPAPQFLGNSTLETYIQGKVPNVSSSCMECHANATTTGAKFSDFTFLLERAK